MNYARWNGLLMKRHFLVTMSLSIVIGSLVAGCSSKTSDPTPQPIENSFVNPLPLPGLDSSSGNDLDVGLDVLNQANCSLAEDLLWESEMLEARAKALDQKTLNLELHSDAWLSLRTEVRNLQSQAFNLWVRSDSLRRFC